MVEQIQILVQQIFGKISIDELELDEIRNFTTRYPYFAPGQFLLLEKLKRSSDPGYGPQLQKSVLYYNDPLGFDFFIENKLHALTEEPAWLNTKPQELTQMEPELSIEPVTDIKEVIESDSLTEPEELLHEIAATEPQEEIILQEETIPQETEADVEVQGDEETEPGLTNGHEVLTTEKNEHQDAEMPALKINEPSQELTFEPFHTVDYFASQGIKLNSDDQPRDKFGKQLKSFTEWLKTMKRSSGPSADRLQAVVVDQKVESMAQKSINEQEVLTEAMAEVWLKQGNKAKAIEIYEKLGLTNPDKYSYFAGLIENINRS